MSHVWKGAQFHYKNTSPTVQHRGGSVMLWACVSANVMGNISLLGLRMDSLKYQQILEANITPSVKKKKKSWRWKEDSFYNRIMILKITSKSTTDYLMRRKLKVLVGPSQSPDLNIIENLFLERDLEAFCKAEWVKIPQTWIERLLPGNKTHKLWCLPNGGCYYYWPRGVPKLLLRVLSLFSYFETVKDGNKKRKSCLKY